MLHAVEMFRAALKRVPSEVKTTLIAANYEPVATGFGVFDNCVPVLGVSIAVDLFKGDCPIAGPGPFLWPAIGVPIIFAPVPSVAPSLSLSTCDGRSWEIMGAWLAGWRTRSL